MERLNVFLGGCGGKGAQDGDCIETLNQDRNALEKEGALAVIIGVLSDAPSQVAQEVHPCLVDRSHGLDCDRHLLLRCILSCILLLPYSAQLTNID